MADAQKGTFSVASTVDDPMTAETLIEVLQDQSIDAFIRPRGGGGTDMLGAATRASATTRFWSPPRR
jgi:hypothetical protein